MAAPLNQARRDLVEHLAQELLEITQDPREFPEAWRRVYTTDRRTRRLTRPTLAQLELDVFASAQRIITLHHLSNAPFRDIDNNALRLTLHDPNLYIEQPPRGLMTRGLENHLRFEQTALYGQNQVYLMHVEPNNYSFDVNRNLIWRGVSHFVQGIVGPHSPIVLRVSYLGGVYYTIGRQGMTLALWQAQGIRLLQEALNRLIQSNELLDVRFLTIFVDVRLAAFGFGRAGPRPLPAHLRHVQGIVYLGNTDNLCGHRALVLGMVRSTDPRRYYHMTTDRPDQLTNAAKDLVKEIGCGEKGMTFPHFAVFITSYTHMRVVLMSLVGQVPIPGGVFTGADWSLAEDPQGEDVVYILYDTTHHHYTYIRDIKMFTRGLQNRSLSVWCHGCLTRRTPSTHKNSTNIQEHKCHYDKCNACGQYFEHSLDLTSHQAPTKTKRSNRTCVHCNTPCYSLTCLEMHTMTCRGKWKLCALCQVRYYVKGTPHVCDQHNCANCGVMKPRSDTQNVHRCYIKPHPIPKVLRPIPTDSDMAVEDRVVNVTDLIDDMSMEHHGPEEDEGCDEALAKKQYFAFDFESKFVRQAIILPSGFAIERPRHVVNFAVVKNILTGASQSFKTIDAFCEFVGQHVKSVFIAHNLKGYDGRLLYDHYVKEIGVAPSNVMWRGLAIMSMKVCDNFFRDSLLHVTAPLADFPSIFGLDEDKFKKGYFPYLFNVTPNQDYKGMIPAIQFYDPRNMSPDKRKAFLKWYDDEIIAGEEYDFQHELQTYCQSDVDILADSMKIYMEEAMNLEGAKGINPLDSATIASYSMKVYRTYSMPENAIAVLTFEEADFARRAFHGGKTDVRKMLHHVSPGQPGIKYMDVQSMYPAAQMFKPMYCGIPVHEVFRRQQPSPQWIQDFTGLIEVDITCTKYLHHPLIVHNDGDTGKLFADLHDKTKIVLCCFELKRALQIGYVVTKVHQAYRYQTRTDLFTKYVRTFLKLKIESSGMPASIKNDQDWDKYHRETMDKLGIDLDRKSMVKNKGKKQLAKLLLNSLWGKFAERDSYVTHTVCHTAEEYMQLDGREQRQEIDIMYRERLKDGSAIVCFKSLLPSMEASYTTNVALALCVSAWGRMILWEELHKLGDRVLYHDTDSIMYIEGRDGQYNIPEGRYLGDWEDEHPNDLITDFVGIGPKSYALKYKKAPIPIPMNPDMMEEWLRQGREFEEVQDEDGSLQEICTECKCKGVSKSYHNAGKLNFDTMRHMVLGHIQNLTTSSTKFDYDRLNGGITTRDESKTLRITYDKGHITDDYTILPFGYERFFDFVPGIAFIEGKRKRVQSV
jgi:hypothetical protein